MYMLPRGQLRAGKVRCQLGFTVAQLQNLALEGRVRNFDLQQVAHEFSPTRLQRAQLCANTRL